MKVVAVSCTAAHEFSKQSRAVINLIAALGVEGDAHAGVKVQHLSRIRRDPDAANLRQVHLIHAELHDALNASGYRLEPGDMGENITTRGINLLALPINTRLHLGPMAIVEVKGLRNPCAQLDGFQKGLMAATLAKDADGHLIRKAGIMGIVVASGEVRPGDAVRVELPSAPHSALEPV